MTYSALPRLTLRLRNSNFAAETSRGENSLSSESLSYLRRILCATVFAGALALAPQAALAQHGGGGHAGGGGHSSGGGHVSSAHSSSSSHVASSNSKPAAAPAAPKPSSTSSSRASAGGYSPGMRAVAAALLNSGAASANARGSQSTNAMPFAAPRNVTIGFPPRTGAEPEHGPIAGGDHLSFFGDGNDVWQEPSSARGASAFGPQSGAHHANGAANSAVPSSAANTAAANSAARPPSNSVATTGAKPALHAPLIAASNKSPLGIPAGIRARPRRPVIGAYPIYYPVYPGFGGYGFGGFGFFGGGFLGGFGFGLSMAPGCDPTWSFGCDAYGDGSFGYDDSANSGSNPAGMSIGAQPAGAAGDDVDGTWQDPPARAENNAAGIAAEKSLVVLYLNDGSVYAVTNYWVAGGKLHYETSYGGDNSLDISALDIQRSVNANAARGVDFTLRPAPPAPPQSAPQDQPQPPQQPN